ncbi:MAG: hypothetical protein LUQ32_00890 [Methanomicrobiales archaeon]|nr:hypothetical protein [Methanomicrobiales archaeon]
MKILLIEDNPADQVFVKELLGRFKGVSYDLVTQLDKGWIESEKVRSFLIRHYRHGEDTAPEICGTRDPRCTLERKAGENAS